MRNTIKALALAGAAMITPALNPLDTKKKKLARARVFASNRCSKYS